MAGVMLSMTSCSPDSDSLGAIDLTAAQLAEGAGFTVSIDQTTNQVTFTSLLPTSYSVYWEYGPKPADGEQPSVSGTSTKSVYKLGIAFDGDYYVRMGAQTRGGIVFSDRANFHINQMNANLISDPTWTMLTGGIGQSKTWVLDLDANGTSIKFGGPKWFYTSGMTWDSFHNAQGENYLDSKQWDPSTAIDPTYASEWYWAADWAGNGWICGAADYGTMTFDLINGANVDVNGTKGSFNMDVASHTISFTGVVPLCINEGDVIGQRPDGNYKIIYLTDNAMQIMFDGGSNDNTPFTLNYVSKDYKDNYVPPVITTITLPEGWMDYVQPFNQHTTTYKFDEDAPFTWFTLAGEEIVRSGFAPHADIADAEFELNSKTKTFKITDCAGNTAEGTYSISADGVLTFSQLPTFGISTNKDIVFGSANNQLQVIKYEVSDRTGDLTELWLGSKQLDAQGNEIEYLGYHFIKQTGGAQVESFTAVLSYSDTGWAFLNSAEVYVTGDGDYTFTLQPNGSTNTQDPYLMFLDIYKILKKHPNADIILKSIKVDGNEVLGSEAGMDDATVSRGVGDDPTTGRRYILNPWNEESATHTGLFKFSSSIDVTITVKFDVGEVVLK